MLTFKSRRNHVEIHKIPAGNCWAWPFLLSRYSADPLWKIYYSRFLIKSCRSSVTDEIKVGTSRSERCIRRSVAARIGPFQTSLTSLPDSSFKDKKRPFFTPQNGAFQRFLHFGADAPGSCDSGEMLIVPRGANKQRISRKSLFPDFPRLMGPRGREGRASTNVGHGSAAPSFHPAPAGTRCPSRGILGIAARRSVYQRSSSGWTLDERVETFVPSILRKAILCWW